MVRGEVSLLGFLSLQSVDTHGFNVCQLTVCQDGLSVLNAYILHRLCYMCFTGVESQGSDMADARLVDSNSV